MVASWRGVLYAAINVVLVAALLAIWAGGGHAGEMFYTVCAIGTLPGLVAGAIIGAIAARLRRFRRSIVVAASVAVVVALGAAMDAKALIPIGCIPTIAMALLLEHKTRTERPTQLSCTAKGALLGLAAIEAVAVLAGIAAAQHAFHRLTFEHSAAGEVIATIGIFGVIPSLIVGAAAGRLAGVLGRLSPRLRLTILAPAMLVMASGVDIVLDADIVLPSIAPTLIAVVLLERWTRCADPIPVARAFALRAVL
jgi:hypothetical protein